MEKEIEIQGYSQSWNLEKYITNLMYHETGLKAFNDDFCYSTLLFIY